MQGKKTKKIQAEAAVGKSIHKTAARGRPRQLPESERRKRLIEAAEHVFVEMGYGAANVSDIARRAGMSKKTIYQIFETKGELFAAVIASRRAALAEVADSELSDNSHPPEEVLRRFLRQKARFVLAPRQAALYRLVIAEAQRAPELARAFYQEGPSKGSRALTEWLAQQHKRKVLFVPDSASAARMLFSMVMAEHQMRLFTGDWREPDEAAIDERVDRAVQLFLNGARRRESVALAPSHEPAKENGRILESPVPAK